MKICKKCFSWQPLENFGLSSYIRKDGTRGLNSWCKNCYVQQTSVYQKSNPEKVRLWTQRKHRKRKYGVSQSFYDAMVETQNGVCAICLCAETKLDKTGRTQELSIDHDHKTGQVRGLLCFACNVAIGKMGDDIDRLQRAIVYLCGGGVKTLEQQ